MAWARWSSADWKTFTPTLTSGSGTPNIGSTGVYTGSYTQIGTSVLARWKIQWGGSGIASGTGAYFIALPLPAATAQVGLTIGNGYTYDASTAYLTAFTIYADTATKMALLYNTTLNAGYAVLGAGVPWTFAGSDYVEGAIQYEAA